MANADIAATAVTALFVPGDRPDRFVKAAAAGPDLVIVDWEDAVAPHAKVEARTATIEALSGGFEAVVRINPAASPTFEAELGALADLARIPGNGLLGIMLPKAESRTEAEAALAPLPAGLPLLALVESAAGVVAAVDIAATPGVTRLAFGAYDFALDVGAGDDDEFLAYARSVLVVASRAAGIAAPLDTPTAEFTDETVVAARARYAQAFGFGGKLCIHPRQVPVVAEAFRPDAAAIEWALKAAGAADGVSSIDGVMVDRPVIERAKSVLRRAGLDH